MTIAAGALWHGIFSGVNPQLAVMTTIRGGVFTRADARACGYRDDEIDYLLDSGGWRRIRRGTYAPARTLIVVNDEMLHLRRVHELLRLGEPGLVASHQSAVALHALPLWGLDLSTVHVTAHRGRAGRHAGGVHRHVRGWADEDVQMWNGLRLSNPSRAVVEVAASASREAAVVVADAALHAGLVTPTTLSRVVALLGSTATAVPARAVVDCATARSGSVGESRLRLLLRDGGLPQPSPSPPPVDYEYGEDAGAPALWFEEQRTVVEFDPWLHYWGTGYDESGELFGAERAAPPTECVWVSWRDLDQPERVAERIRSAFARAEARSGVRVFDPSRPRTGRRRRSARRLSSPGDLPC